MSAAKEYLMRLGNIRTGMRRRQEQLEELRALASGGAIRYDKVRVQGGTGGSRTEELLIRCAELSAKVGRLMAYYEQEKDRIIGQLEALPDTAADDQERARLTRHADLLYRRYVEGKPLGRIAEEMGYSEEHVRRMHGKALKDFYYAFLLFPEDGDYV